MTNNIYSVTIQVSDGVNPPASQDIQVTVTDDPETGGAVSSTYAEGINDADIDDDNSSDGDVLDDGTSFLNSFLWAHDFDINSITLPETVMDEISTEAFDLADLYGLLGSQTDSLALNFESFADDTSIDIEAVKPVDLSPSNPVLDHYQDPWLEDLVYTSELG